MTGRGVIIGMWACAAIVMVSSARNAAWSFAILGESPLAGFALGVAVDVALAVALIGDRALHLAGRKSRWGRALRVTTCLMSGALNCAVYAWMGQVGIAVFHSFLTILLILLTEYSQDFTLQTGEIETERQEAATAAERAEHQARQTASRQERELATHLASVLAFTTRATMPTPASRQATSPGAHQANTARLTRRAPARPPRGKTPTRRQPEPSALIERARPLVADQPQIGRHTLARELGCTEHQARKVLEQLGPRSPAQQQPKAVA